LVKEKIEKESKKKESVRIEVKIEAPIQTFGFFTFKEFGPVQEEITRVSSPIYVFPKSTAAIAQV